ACAEWAGEILNTDDGTGLRFEVTLSDRAGGELGLQVAELGLLVGGEAAAKWEQSGIAAEVLNGAEHVADGDTAQAGGGEQLLQRGVARHGAAASTQRAHCGGEKEGSGKSFHDGSPFGKVLPTSGQAAGGVSVATHTITRR